jgi:hypothetical protein
MFHLVTLDKFGCAITIPVRYSNKAKRIAIRINHCGAELVLPNKKLPLIFQMGSKFLFEKETWLRQKLQQQHTIKQLGPDINSIHFLGKKYSLIYVATSNNAVELEEDVIRVYSKSLLQRSTLIAFLKTKLLIEIAKYADFLRENYNLKFSKIKIMNNKSRWGSCSSKAVLSFNWRLVFAPIEIIKYLVVHEMCHLIEMNHSQRFWDLVAKLDPDYQLSRSWLKKHYQQLHQYL